MNMQAGDLVFYRPYSRARENVPVLAGVEDLDTQTGVVRVFPGDVLEVVAVRSDEWVLARYPGVEGVLLVGAAYCELWKARERVADV